MATITEGMLIRERFEIRKYVGGGGFGAVYHGFDNQLQREVAIKRMMQEIRVGQAFDNEKARQKRKEEAIQEARKIALLNHPNILAIYDVFELEDEFLIVMEYLPGGTLHDWLCGMCRANQWMTVPETIRILKAILSGLHAAHSAERGPIIHQDLKPKNVLFDRNGTPKIADFGLATVGIVQAIETVHPGRWPHAGSDGYMSPEQLLGAQLDARSDLFNVGLIAYLLLAASHPFTDPRFLFPYREMVLEPYRDLSNWQDSNLPPEAGDFVARLLATKPDERPQSAAEALDELEIVEERYRKMQLDRILRYHDALVSGETILALSAVELAAGISECKHKGLYAPGTRLYELSRVDFSVLPNKAREQLDADYKFCKLRVGREVEGA